MESALTIVAPNCWASADATVSSTSVVGTLPEEAVIRAIVTNLITNQTENTLVSDNGRTGLQQQILSDIKTQTARWARLVKASGFKADAD